MYSSKTLKPSIPSESKQSDQGELFEKFKRQLFLNFLKTALPSLLMKSTHQSIGAKEKPMVDKDLVKDASARVLERGSVVAELQKKGESPRVIEFALSQLQKTSQAAQLFISKASLFQLRHKGDDWMFQRQDLLNFCLAWQFSNNLGERKPSEKTDFRWSVSACSSLAYMCSKLYGRFSEKVCIAFFHQKGDLDAALGHFFEGAALPDISVNFSWVGGARFSGFEKSVYHQQIFQDLFIEELRGSQNLRDIYFLRLLGQLAALETKAGSLRKAFEPLFLALQSIDVSKFNTQSAQYFFTKAKEIYQNYKINFARRVYLSSISRKKSTKAKESIRIAIKTTSVENSEDRSPEAFVRQYAGEVRDKYSHITKEGIEGLVGDFKIKVRQQGLLLTPQLTQYFRKCLNSVQTPRSSASGSGFAVAAAPPEKNPTVTPLYEAALFPNSDFASASASSLAPVQKPPGVDMAPRRLSYPNVLKSKNETVGAGSERPSGQCPCVKKARRDAERYIQKLLNEASSGYSVSRNASAFAPGVGPSKKRPVSILNKSSRKENRAGVGSLGLLMR